MTATVNATAYATLTQMSAAEAPALTPTAQSTGSDAPDTAQPEVQSVPVELIISGILLTIGLIYGFLYWRGQMAADRYDAGFVIDRCPVCGGELHVTINQKRIFGIARVRTTVRCQNCRSLLREVATRRWRYAVDHSYSLTLFHRFNGKVIDEATLIALGEDAPPPRRSAASSQPDGDGGPVFIDE